MNVPALVSAAARPDVEAPGPKSSGSTKSRSLSASRTLSSATEKRSADGKRDGSMGIPSVCRRGASPRSQTWPLGHGLGHAASLAHPGTRIQTITPTQNPRKSRASGDGHGWARSSDLSRVKRLPSESKRRRSAGSLAITPVSRWVVYAFGLLGFIAVLVHRISLWTSGNVPRIGALLPSGPDGSEGVIGRV
jgi:hypothetical protein